MKQISREGIQRMINVTGGTGGTGGGGGSFDPAAMGIATEAWVEENYLSKAFFTRLFKAYGPAETEGDPDVEVEPNDLESDITSIEAMFGFWTQQYISALGQGSGGGGGGGGSDTLADLIDVELTNPVAGQVLKYNGTKWINSAASAGTVTSVAMSVPTGFSVTGSPITVSGVLGLSFADGYSLPTTAKQTNWDAAYSWTSVSRTTLADYGITDAKFGTPGTDSIPITLGSTTQSVLTQHQSLANYYTKSETDGKFLTISFFRSLFRAYTSSNTEVQPNDGSTSTIASIKAMFGFWTEQYLSALGQSSGGGGGVTLNQPLQGINQAGLSAPTTAGQILVYNGTKWAYAGNINITNLTAYAGTFNSTVTAVGSFTSQGGNFIAQNGGFKINGYDDTYVLLAGGGTKLLSEIGGGGSYLPLDASSPLTGALHIECLGDQKLYLKSTDADNYALIAFVKNDNTVVGNLGVRGTTDLYWGTSKLLTGIDSTMITDALGYTPAATSDLSNYIPKSGNSTLSGILTISPSHVSGRQDGLILNDRGSGNSEATCIRFTSASYTTGHTFHVAPDTGTGYIDTNEIITSATISSQTVNAASKLETARKLWGNDFDGTGNIYGNIEIRRFGTSVNEYLTISVGDVLTTFAGYDSDGGMGFNFTSNGSSTFYIGRYGNVGIGDTNPAYKLAVNGDVSATNFYGALKGNADTATKLNASITLWGQSFDGSGNISGSISSTGSITPSATTTYDIGSSALKYSNGYIEKIYFGTSFLSNETGYVTFGCNSNEFRVGAGSSSLYINYRGVSGKTTVTEWRWFAGGGSSGGYAKHIIKDLYATNAIGIGTDVNSSYSLDVVGNAEFGGSGQRKVRLGSTSNAASISMAYPSGTSYVSLACMNLTSANNLAIGHGVASNGNTVTVYFANGVYMEWDSTNNAVKLNGSFYATGSVSALGQSSSGTTYLDQATADARYLKLSGGQTMTGSFSGTSITLSSQMKSTNAVATAYLTVGTSSLSTSYTLYVNGNAGIKHIVIGDEQQVNTVNCAVIQTLSSRGIYIKSGSAPNYVDGTWANASDIRLKDIVSNAGASVEQVADAPVFNYRWKSGGTQVMLGTSAQYWRNVFNFGVSEGPDSYLYMDYASIALASAVMVARKVQSHEERIAALEAEIMRLQQKINELKVA